MCDCQNQLTRWDWSERPHNDLPELCKKSMELPPRASTPIPREQEDNESSATESDTEWEHCK